MIAWATTLKDLRGRIDAMIAVVGEDAPVGTATHRPEHIQTDGLSEGGKLVPAGEFLDDVGVQIELVYVNKRTGQVVGDEANDYKPKAGEVAAVKIS